MEQHQRISLQTTGTVGPPWHLLLSSFRFLIIQHHSLLAIQLSTLLRDPLLGIDPFVILIARGWNPFSLQRLQAAVIVGSYKVHDTISWPLSLLAWGGRDPMTTGAQHTIRKLDGRISGLDQ